MVKTILQSKHFLFLFITALLLMLSSSKASAISGGTYTIDSSLAASSTNYRDFVSAVSDLKSGTRSDGGTPNGAGVTGAVTFNVAAGTFVGQLDITAITGASATNTITFDGGAGNAATRIVQAAPTALATAFTIKINNAQFINLRNITIRGAGTTYGWPLHIFNVSSNVKVKNCIIDFTSSFTLHTNNNFCALVVNNSTAGPTNGTTSLVNLEIDSNRFIGGYANYFYGASSNTGIYFRGNSFDSTDYYGLYLYGSVQAKVVNNNFNMKTTGNVSSYGIYFTTSNASTGNFHEISNNKIINCGLTGIYLGASNGQSSPRSQMFNNAIGGGFRTLTNPIGINISNSYAWDVFHNSVNLDVVATGTQATPIYLGNCCTTGATLLDVRNNIFAITAAGSTAYVMYMPNGYNYAVASTAALNYNIYYKQSASISDPFLYNGGTILTMANFVNNSSYNANSFAANPMFTSAKNLKPITPCNNGIQITAVTSSINNITRNNPPDIGAYEVTPVNDDIGIERITSPALPFTAGTQNVSLLLRNYGSNVVTSANAYYDVNGAGPVFTTWSGSLASCATTTVTFSGANQYNFMPNTQYSIKAYSNYPNSTSDANTINDTTVIPVVFPALSGNYTIDQSSPASATNFVSFSAVALALNNGGVNGPVVFTVLGSTPYAEQMTLSNVQGVSATNTITFDGGVGNAASRIINFAAATQVASHTIRIDNTPWVRIKNLTIRGSGASYAWPVHLMGNNASNEQVRNCIIDFGIGGGVNGTSDNFTGIVVNGGAASISTNSIPNNIDIDSNQITGGNNGIYVYSQGSYNLNIRYNTITNANYYGIYMYYMYGYKCNNNTINMRVTGNAASNGIYSNFTLNNSYQYELMNNVITDAGQYGIQFYYMQGGSTNPARIINNMIGGNFRSTDPAAVYFNQNCQYVNFWFNSLIVDNATSGTQSSVIKFMNSCSNFDVRNNNFVSNNVSANTYILYADATSSGFNNLNYNNYYKVGNPISRFIFLNGTNYSLANYKGTLGYNLNSVSIDPTYTNNKNLKTTLICNNGVSISGVTTDFEGELRNNPPDIGCDENLSASLLDLSVSAITGPTLPIAIGTQNVRVVLRNNGTSTINSAEVNYQVNGGPVQTIFWTGTLNACDTQTVEFNATSGAGGTDQRVTFLPGVVYTVTAFTALPNSSTDLVPVNDTARISNVCTGLSGTFTIDSAGTPSATTFTSFASAVTALTCGGISGPVVFNVMQGTYTGQLDLTAVTGANAVNTITFDGGAGNASTRIINFAATSTALPYTLRLNNTQFITLNNLTIRGSGTTAAWPLHIFGTCNAIKVKNCVVDFVGGNGLTGTSDNYAGIVLNNFASAPNATSGSSAATNIEIDSNRIIGGNTSTYLIGNGTNTGIAYRYNIADSANTNGIYVSNIIAPKINNNTVEMRSVAASTTSQGIYLATVSSNATSTAEINRNKVTDAALYGIYVTGSSGIAASRSQMINNSFGGGFRNTTPYGMYFTSSNYWNIWNNSVNIDNAATGTASAIYFTGSTVNDCRNNNFAITNASASVNMYPFRAVSGVTFSALNYNNYHKSVLGLQHIQVNGTNYDTLAYNTATSGGLNSIRVNPIYTATRNLLPTVALNGVQLAAVPTDILGVQRNNPPTMGAYEKASSATTDLGIISVLAPDTFLSAGLQSVVLTVKNFGATTINSFNIRHTVNGTNMQDSLFSGLSLATNDVMQIVLDGTKRANILPAVLTSFKVYIHQPNSSNDDNLINDTVTVGPKITSLKGIYTINPSGGTGGTNYTSFRAAINALNTGGVSGPITFIVSAATYNEQVNIAAITGNSNTNTITFDGGAGNAATRIIDTAANTTSNFWTVRLNVASNIIFRNLTIRASGATYGAAVHVLGNSNFSKFKNCVMEITGAGATSTSANYIPVIINNSTTITSLTTGSQVNNLEFDSNSINNGYYGIYAYSVTSTPYAFNNKFRRNNIVNAYNTGGYFYYQDGMNISNNNINMRNVAGLSSYGLYLYFCYTTGTNFHTVNGNKITNAGNYGIYAYYFGSTNARHSIANNMLAGGFKVNGSYGLSLQYSNNVDVFNNSVNVDFLQTGSEQYSAFYLYSGSSIDVRNNIFATTGGPTNVGLPVYIGALPSGIFRLDNNNYYRANATSNNLIYLAGTYYNAINYLNGGGYNTASFNKNPNWVSTNDLHILEGCTKGANLGLLEDFDGQIRAAIPNVGADEFSGANNDIGLLSVAPFTAGLQDIRVVLKNYGSNTITSANVSYSVNGSLAKTIPWSGVLGPCDTVSVSFTGANQYNFAMGTAYQLTAYTSNPNLTADPKTSNDTIILGPSCVFLNGNYTINATGSGVNNFTSFTAAANALTCGGISGPIKFTVAPGTYTEQITLPAIAGSSPTNTITFDGDSAANRIITFAPTVSTEYHTIRINNASNIIFRNLTIQNNGASYGSGVHVMGASNNIKIKNCIIQITGTAATSASGSYAPIVVNNNADGNNITAAGSQASGLEIDSNRLVNGYYGIVLSSNTGSPYLTNALIRKNTIDSAYYYGIYTYYNNGLTFHNNTVNMRINGSANSQGVYLYFNFGQGTNAFTVTNNKITNAGQYGMYLYYTYSAGPAYRSLCANNMIGGTFRNASSVGLYCSNLNYWDIFNNSVNLDYPTTTATSSAMYVQAGGTHDIRNNMLVYSANSGAGMAFNASAGSILTTLDFNNYVNNASSNVVTVGTTTYTSSNFIGGGGYNAGSRNQNPGFTSANDLHIGSGCINGTSLASVTTDIDGHFRATPPDIGCDEYIGSVNNDIGVSFIMAPQLPFNAGIQDVRVRLNNFGANTITSANIKYTVNGGSLKTINWTGSLAPCDTTSILFTGSNQFNFAFGTTYVLKAYSELPNSVTDANRVNDTTTSTFCTAFSGVYTINPSGSGTNNFTSISAAANAISCGGVTGPVVFNIAPGTYNEQVTISNIPGASAINTVVFDGGNAATRTVTFTPTVNTSAHTIQLNSAPFVSILNLTIISNGASFGNPVHVFGGSNSSKVKNCVITFGSAGQTSTGSGYIGILVNGFNNIQSPTTNGNYITGLEIDSNKITYGYYGILVFGASNTPLSSNNNYRFNKIDSSYYYGFYAYYQDGVKVKNNTINIRVNGSVNSTGVYLYVSNSTGSNFHEISNNKVINAGQYGMYIYFSNNVAGSRGKIVNNMIGGGFRSSSATGLYLYYGDYWDVWNNSVNLDIATTSNTLSAFSANYSTLDIRNNHFVYSAASGTGLPFYLSSSATALNYNNYYNAAANNLLYYNSATYTTSTFVGGGSMNANSINVNPQFASKFNLRTGGCMKGVTIAGVTTDIDGDTRNTPPDIGADEALSNDAGVIALTAPVQPITPGLQNITVVVKNFGTNTITSLNVTYNINGLGPVTQALTGITLLPCSTQTVTFTGAQQFNFGGVTNAVIYTSLPNGVNDNFKANDTINPSLCGPLNGVYTINPTGSGANNFTSFSSALSSMVCAGITGPVTFNVAAGTYTEQLDITNITGASAINTITFDGGANNAATRILTYSASVNNLRHTVRFNACQYVNFRNLTIQTTGASYGWGVHYFGAAHNNSVKKCIIDIAGTNAASSTNNTFIGVVGSGSATSETSQQQLQNVVIDSNTINNGYYGIILYGNSTTQSTGTLVRGNNVNGAYYYGVYLYSQDGFVLNNNTIVNRTGVNASQNSNGFYINNCVATTTNFHEINGNKITDATQYGIYINSSSSSGSRSRIWNNMVGGGFTSSNSYGIFLSGSTWDIFQNSVNLDASTNNAQYAALFINSGSNNAIKNNVLAYTATSGTGLPMYIPSTTYVAGAGSINYNNYYKAGLTGTINPLLYLAGNYTLANFTSGSYNNSSISINPLFLGTRNLHIVDGCYNGDSLGVTMDIDGNARASYADIGADELLSGVDDIGVKAMLQPTIPIVSGLSDIQVIVKNYGSNTVIGGTVKYSVNNVAPVSVAFTDTILPCSFDTVTFTGANQFNFIGGSTYGIKVYTETPNGNPDVYNLNDTLAIPPICVGMAGVYTINPTGSGATNYTSFGNAITALLCGGISGPVTFNVAAATYNEQIVIPAIPGASVTNTVVFDGGAGNAATRILVNGTTTNNSRHTVRFDNTSFIQFRNLTVRNTNATYAWPVHIYGNSNNIKIKNSIIEVTGAGATSSSSNYINVVVSGALNSSTTNTLVDSIEIDSNVINGSYASIWDYNNNGTANRFRGNTLNNPTNYGIYIYNNTEVKIQNNIINMWPLGPNTSTGIYMYFCLTSGSMLHEVTGNKIFDMGQYGIYNYFVYGSFSNPSRINNNMIGGGFRNTSSHNGIYVDYGNYLNIDHNSINSDTAISSTTGLLNITNSSAINVRNNIFSITDAASQAIALNVPTATNVTTVNYNNYYKAGTPATLITIGSNYSPATFVGGGGYNANSINRDPLFTSKRDLHVGNGCNNGIAIATITTDIDGNVRNNPPDMGADEVTGGVNNNIGVTAMLSPVPPVSTGTQTVSVIISNLGNSIVSSADINYTVNGGIPVTQSWSGTLNPCDTTLVTFTTTFNVSTGTAYTIKAYTSLPNGTTDGNNLDDTLTVGPLCPAMAGNYTIDPAGSGATNFTTFTAAANALNCGGIVAPVTFTVANGTYNEQVNINAINGVNDSTTVTFIGQSRAGVVLTYNATTTTSAHTLRLNASPFVNFYNMTIQTAGTTYGVAVHLLGASHMVKIKNCTIRINGTGANGTSQYFIPLLINGSSDLTNLTQNGTNINNIEIDSNRIYSGYYSIYYYGRTSTPYSQNNKFRMNSIDSSYYTAVYAYYAEGFKFLNNKVNVRINGTAGSTGLSLNNCYNTGINFHDISNNRISGAGQYGAYLYFASGTSSANRSRFINNMIGGGFRSTAASGLYWQYSDFWNIYNNTVNLDFATNNQQYAAASLYYYTNFTLDIRNNIFNYTATTGTGIPFYLGGTAIVGTFNYNNFFNGAAANLINLNGTTYTTATYTGGGGYNANSYNVNIPFMSTNDLHLTNSTSKGIAIPAVTTDIDGETRLSPPDIGADEYFSSMDIGVLSVDSPTTNFCGATKNIVVKLKNYGNQTVNNAIIYWTINGVSQPTYSWTGTLASGNTSAQIVLGNYNFTTGGTFAISAYSAFPNSTTDINANNDSASSTINVTGSVTPTISISASNSSICSGMSVTFTATATNGGSTPTYQWRINGFTVGTNSNTFTSTALAHGDSVICILSSSALCATIANVVSNHVKMNVGISIVPDVTIATTATTICSGSLVSFTATPVNGGLTPSYQWKQNGVNVGTNSNVFTPATISHNDSFTVVLTSSLGCAIPSKDTSNSIKMTVNPLIVPSVSITAFATSFCASTVDTFTAFPVNAGTSPSFQWKKNAGVNIGTNSDKLIVSNLSDNDSVYVVITSNAVCPSPTTATSNKIGVTVIPSVVPTAVVTSATTTICAGDAIKFNLATTNGGTTPSLLWKKNGVTIATNVDSVITSSLANNDTIYVEYTSNATCAVPTSIVSNKKVITVNPIVAPDVTIAASGNNVCAGTSIQFTATPVNGGATPHYQWYKNGVAAGTDSAKYTSSTFADGDSITVVLTSNATCISRQSDTSASVKLIINPILTASVAVTASQTTICSGTSVVFNTSITNGGTTPHYVWKKNGITVGTDSVAFVSTNLANNDSVYVILTSSAGCLSANNITSNKIAMNVTTTVVPVVSITASNSSICSGTSVTFTASSLNGGTGVQYQWKRNGANVGTDNDSFTTASLTDNDSISVQMTSTAACASPAIVTSNKIRMAVTPTVIPAVSIAASATSVCVNSPVTFTATPTNGGSGVQYQWKRNGLNVGTNNPVLTTSLIANNDSISVQMISSAACASPATVTSNKVVMTVSPNVIPTVNITVSINTACVGGLMEFTATPVNGGTTPQYQWKRNGLDVGINNGVFTSSSLTDNDSISVQMTSSAACAAPTIVTSNKIRVFILPKVAPAVSVSQSANNVCSGTTVTFTAADVNGGVTPSHTWLKNGLVVGSDSIKYTTSVNYGDEIKCILTSNAACITKDKDTSTASLLVKRLPAKPIITRVGDSLMTAVTGNAFQWYVNNIEIPGATNSKHKAKQTGNYIVTVDSLGCQNTSDVFAVTSLGIKDVVGNDFVQLAPNPTSSSVQLTAKFTNSEETVVSVYDMSGKQITQITLGKADRIDGQVIDLSDMESGVYLIHVLHGNKLTARKVVKAE